MNALVGFRLCTLSDKELADKANELIDRLYEVKGDYGSVIARHIPAKPNSDFDLIIGELIYRFNKRIELDGNDTN